MTSTISTKPPASSVGGRLFNDQSLSSSRRSGPSAMPPYGGADIGEVTSTANRIPDGDLTAWYTEWRALAERIHTDADRSAAQGHPVSARESYLRASNYYRLCEFYLRVDSSNDPEVRQVGQLSVDAFARAANNASPAPGGNIPLRGHHAARVVDPSRRRDSASHWRGPRRSSADALIQRRLRQHRGRALLCRRRGRRPTWLPRPRFCGPWTRQRPS